MKSEDEPQSFLYLTSVDTSNQHIESLINQGRYFEAKTQASTLLKEAPSLRTQQLFALALSKCGVPEAALLFLKPIYEEHPDEPETAGILGGIYKELFIKSKSQAYAILSRDTYRKNFAATKNYYTGINAAALAAITGQFKVAQQTASEVLTSLETHSPTFWEEATRAEALLIRKDSTQATTCYFRVRELAGSDWGKVNSIYNQLWLLNHYMSVPHELLQIFKPPVTVAFVGHMIDHPTRKQSRFPLSIESNIKAALITHITDLNAKVGYCSLACGGDILFAEAMVETGGEVNIHLPFCEEDFLDASVRFAGPGWEERFHKLTKQFPVTYFTRGRYRGHADLFFHQATVIFGTTLMHSREKPHLLTVLSERERKQKEGGTLDTLTHWPYPETIVTINPDKFFFSKPSLTENPEPKQAPKNEMPVLFLLMVDFPNTSEEEKKAIGQSINVRIQNQFSMEVQTQWKDGRLRLTAAARNSIMELFEMIIEVVLRFHSLENFRAALHVGPFSTGEKQNLSDEATAILSAIHHHAHAGQFLASSPAAAELALSSEKRNMDYAGKLVINEIEMEIYRVE